MRISQYKKIHFRANTSVRRDKQVQKRKTARVIVRDSSRKGHLRSFGVIKLDYNRVDQVYQFHQNRLTSPYNVR